MQFLDFVFASVLVIVSCFLIDNQILAQRIIKFQVERNETDDVNCVARENQYKFIEGQDVSVLLATPDITLNSVQCGDFLKTSDFSAANQMGEREAKINVTKAQDGKWKCLLETQFFLIENKTTTKSAVECITNVSIESAPTSSSTTQLYIIIGSSVGGLLVVFIIFIIICQAVVIMRYKRKLGKGPLVRLETPPSRDHQNRYSTMPGEKAKKKKAKREESGIYQSLENIRETVSIIRRPPMPLPNEIDENVYDDGNTLNKMFAPDPPPTDTLPKKRIMKSETKPALPKKPKPSVTEDYEYPDPTEFMGQDTLRRRNNSPPLPPKPSGANVQAPMPGRQKAVPVIPGGAIVMNELEQHFMKIKEKAASKQNQEPPPPATKHQAKKDKGFKKQAPAPSNQTKLQDPKQDLHGSWRPEPKPAQRPRQPKSVSPEPWSPTTKNPGALQLERPSELNNPEIQRNCLPPRPGPISGLRSPPKARVPPMARVAPVMQTPPTPRPPGACKPAVVEETYEAVAEDFSSDEEYWCPPTSPEHIYNV